MAKSRFVLKGESYCFTKEFVEEEMEGIKPGARGTILVKINGSEYPVKQVLAKISGLDKMLFTSNDAVRILSKLGFEIFRG